MIKTEIDRNEYLKPGEKIEMHFKAFGPNWYYLRASELAILIWRLEQKNPDYELLSHQTPPGEHLILTFLIKDPKEPQPQVQQAGVVTPLIIAAIVIGGGLFAWLTLDKVYKITDSPAGKVALAGTGFAGIAVLILVVLLILRQAKD